MAERYIMKVKYELIHKDKHTKARYGMIETNYGKYETPIFFSVSALYANVPP